MNGLELTKTVLAIDDEIKVILMSAYDLEEDQLKEINTVHKQNLKKHAAIIHVDMDSQITIAGTTVDVTDLS